MTRPGFAYMLRFCLPPGHMEEKRLDDLVDFCRQGRVSDVMFFIAAEELNNGHLTLEETRPWLDAIGRAQARLEPLGVTTSINPWITFLHATRGRMLRESQPFRLMADPYGTSSTAVVCPLCPEWRQHISGMYAYFASINPSTLWVEDDFRFHNHDPLQWGGCFCEDHLNEFARMAGVASLEREDFLNGLLQPGEPHPYRRIWLDHCRQTMVDLARLIGDAVHRVSPQTRIGLMTSVPSVHAAEGRDWHGMFAAFDGERNAIVRTHLPAYTEVNGFKYWWDFNHVSRHTAEVIPAHTEAYPELENYPFSLLIKSEAFQKFQLETSLLLGSRGITLDLNDVMGNGIYLEEHSDRLLSAEKDFLDTIASFGLHVRQQAGVRVLVDEKSAYTLHTVRGQSMEELYPRETLWASYLSALGIANRYDSEWPAEPDVVAVSGQLLRNKDETAIRKLFDDHFVLLDGEAVHTLHEMGLGSIIGVSKAVWHRYDSGFQSYEEVANGREYASIGRGRMTAQIAIGNYLEIEYTDGAEPVSQVFNAQGEAVAPGMTLVRGRVFIMPYGQLLPDAYQGLLSPVRRAIIRETLLERTQRPPLVVVSYAPHCSVFLFESAGCQTIAIVNASSDDIEGLELGGKDLPADGWMAYSRSDPQGRPAAIRSSGGKLLIDGRFPALSMKVLRRSV